MFHFKNYQVFLILSILNWISDAKINAPEDFKSIFNGRCNAYKLIDSPAELSSRLGRFDCKNLLNEFENALENIGTTNSCPNYQIYESFVKSIFHKPEKNMIFWSGTGSFSKEYVHDGKYGFALESSLAGYTLDKLTCSYFPNTLEKKCKNCSLVYSFWKQLSIQFAREAFGDVEVLLNASFPTAYYNSSVFRTLELPNMNGTKVTKLTAILVKDIGVPAKSRCGEGSMKELENDLKAKNIKFECQDNPDHVRHLLCSRIRSRSSECDFAYANSPQSPQIHSILVSMSTLILSSLYFF